MTPAHTPRAGVTREKRLRDPGDHRIRFVERLAQLEQLPHLDQEGHLSSTLLQFVGVALELRMGLLELPLEACAGRDVDDGGEHQRTARRLHRSQTDLHREVRAIAAASGQFQPAAHRTGGRVKAIPGSVRGVSLGHARWHETLDRLSKELLWRPAERVLGPRAGVHDPTATVDGNDGVGARVEHDLGAESEWCGGSGSRRPRGVHVASEGIRRESRMGYRANRRTDRARSVGRTTRPACGYPSPEREGRPEPFPPPGRRPQPESLDTQLPALDLPALAGDLRRPG